MSIAEDLEKLTPFTVSIAEARRISGLSRSEIYRRLADNRLQAIKSGSRTLIILDTLMRHLKALPLATFRAPVRRGSAR